MGAIAEKVPRQVRQIDLDMTDLGRPGTLRYNVLTFVINEEYERALKVLNEFIEAESEYPDFKDKTERFVSHAIDLTYAIRTKRNFPGIAALTRTKQQELRDKFKEHFKELKTVLRKIENSLEELRLNDVKTTRILIKSLWTSAFVLFISALVLDVYQGLGMTAIVVIEDYIEKMLNWLFALII
ncbi:MAG: hypothetical protein WA160_03745 [Pseudobdellovibrio sp.]